MPGRAPSLAPAPDELAETRAPSPGTARLRRLWTYRHPSLVPVLVLWGVLALGLADYARSWSPTAPGLLGSNDWLINYQGGFVRRGLAGELLYGFHDVVSFVSLTQELLVLQLGLYVAVGVVVTLLALRVQNRLLPWVLLSPAAFLFSSYSVLGGFRKDLLLFLALGLVALAATARTRRGRTALLVAGAVLYVVFVLSWEAGILFLPVVALLLVRATPPEEARRTRTFVGVVVATSLVAFVAEVLSPGSHAVVAGICRALARAGVPYGVDCFPGGKGILGLAWLQLSWHDSAHQVARLWPGYAFYAVWFALALAPFVISGWARAHRALTLCAVGAVLPLLVVGSDYGRWVHLSVTCLSIAWLMTAEREPDAGRPRGALELVALTAWVTCWSVPYWKDPFLVGGFFDALHRSGLLHLVTQYGP